MITQTLTLQELQAENKLLKERERLLNEQLKYLNEQYRMAQTPSVWQKIREVCRAEK